MTKILQDTDANITSEATWVNGMGMERRFLPLQ